MASSMVVKVACLAVMCIVLCLPLTQAALSCGQVVTTAAPCVAYLKGSSGGAVPGPCCNAIRTLNSAKTTPDRQAVCRCLKPTVLNLPGLNPNNLAGLPGKCGVNLPYKVTPSIDCNKYGSVSNSRERLLCLFTISTY
ncbi:non-specific lipid-transfer protein 1-like [Gastrolobium bilobum]|uniref:non-specific lipid-transfer protein 1-like n=1 Tax=Gastrolobium bilobum TaxID=150636 RepID=UPI002AB0D795|nr:non-specific lipid-transfer protein 1-like [Gastrolobium bilobum]